MDKPISIDEWIGAIVPDDTEMRTEMLAMMVMFHTIKDQDIRHAIIAVLRSITKKVAVKT